MLRYLLYVLIHPQFTEFLNIYVTIAPNAITMAETIKTREVPPHCNKTGMKNTPNTAPTLPREAAIPVPNPLVATGYTIGGRTYVTRCGPIFKKSSNAMKAIIEIHFGQ